VHKRLTEEVVASRVNARSQLNTGGVTANTTILLIFWRTATTSLRLRFSSYIKNYNEPAHRRKLGPDFLKKYVLEGFAVFSKLLDTFMELVESHLVLKKFPAEFGLIFNIGNFRNGFSLCRDLWAKPPRDTIRTVPQLLEEGRRDSKEVNACKCLNLANLQKIS
jgi:hypothetical protein